MQFRSEKLTYIIVHCLRGGGSVCVACPLSVSLESDLS